MALAGNGEKVQGLEGNCHPSKLEETLVSIQTQGQFSIMDLTQFF